MNLELEEIAGSSPRVRGTVLPVPAAGLRHRFIPACAGNGTESAGLIPRSPVHPRVCGERGIKALHEAADAGSSPRVRGTALQEAATPVHPRVCGERGIKALHEAADAGSSPRVRGTGVGVVEVVAGRRFIPACAGNGAQQQQELV